VPAGVQRIEIGDAVDAQEHRLAIDDKRGGSAVSQRGLGDQRIAGGPIVAVPREQPHGLALSLDDQPIAVVLDLVKPIAAGWNLFGGGSEGRVRSRFSCRVDRPKNARRESQMGNMAARTFAGRNLPFWSAFSSADLQGGDARRCLRSIGAGAARSGARSKKAQTPEVFSA
jgi:hypothetical protein